MEEGERDSNLKANLSKSVQKKACEAFSKFKYFKCGKKVACDEREYSACITYDNIDPMCHKIYT